MSEPLEEMFSLPTSGKEFDLQTARLILALLNQDLRNHKTNYAAFKETVEKDYTLKSEVKLPIRLIYGTAGAVLMAFVAALVSLVMKGHPPG